ncbi:MAG: hypothetical protein Rubg2KO_06070 [Rubricoccaceae bacterium]
MTDIAPVMRLRSTLQLFAASALLLSGTVVMAAPVASSDAGLELVQVDDTPKPFKLSAPRPNPFRTSSALTLTVEEAGEITVTVHDALGRRVALLREGQTSAGTYTLRVDADNLPPGLYIVRATNDKGDTATRSLALVR